MNENRLLYVALIDKSDPRLLGVIKKVESILRVFNKCDYEAAILCFNTKEEMELYNNEKVLRSFRITHTVSRKSLLSRYKRKKEIFDIIYNVATKVYRSDIVIFRYIMTDHFLFMFLMNSIILEYVLFWIFQLIHMTKNSKRTSTGVLNPMLIDSIEGG